MNKMTFTELAEKLVRGLLTKEMLRENSFFSLKKGITFQDLLKRRRKGNKKDEDYWQKVFKTKEDLEKCVNFLN